MTTLILNKEEQELAQILFDAILVHDEVAAYYSDRENFVIEYDGSICCRILALVLIDKLQIKQEPTR